MENNQNIIEQQEPEPDKKKKRRTAAEIAADKLARENQLLAEAETAKANIMELEKKMSEMIEKIKSEKRKLKSSRNTVRTHAGMIIYGDLINILGYKDTESHCFTTSDYEELRKSIVNHVKKLIKIEKEINVTQ